MEKKVKEESPNQKQTTEPVITNLQLANYKKNLKSNVELLELEARYHKAKFEITYYNSQMEMLKASISTIEEDAKKEKLDKFAKDLGVGA